VSPFRDLTEVDVPAEDELGSRLDAERIAANGVRKSMRIDMTVI
jgi:hypothetical protein